MHISRFFGPPPPLLKHIWFTENKQKFQIVGVDSLLSDYLGLKDFIQLFEMEELGASETHKTEILDFEVLKS